MGAKKNVITCFTIKGKTFRVVGTDHSIRRLHKRDLDEYHIASAVLGLGKKLEQYNNSGIHIMVVDEGKSLSCVMTVENFTVVLITVLDKSDPYVKENTVIENFSFKVS